MDKTIAKELLNLPERKKCHFIGFGLKCFFLKRNNYNKLFMKKFCAVILFLGCISLYANPIDFQQHSLVGIKDSLHCADSLIVLSDSIVSTSPENAEVYAQEAKKISEMTGNRSYLAQSYFQLGLSQYYQNKYDQAISYFNECIRLAKIDMDLRLTALALNRSGNSYQLKGNYFKALEKYEEASRINRSINNKIEIARTLTNIGSIYRIFGKYEEAISMQLEALGLYEQTEYAEGFAWTALNIARLFKRMGNFNKALEYAAVAHDYYKQIEKENTIKTGVTLCLKEKADISTQMGNYEKAIEYNQKVLEMNQTSNNEFGVANSYVALGKIYFEKGELQKASEYLNTAYKIKKDLNDPTDLSIIHRYLGNIYAQRKIYDKSVNHLKQSLTYAKEQNTREEIKETYLSFSIVYEELNDTRNALYYFQQYSYLKDSLNNQKINELELQFEFDKRQRQMEFEQKEKEAKQQARLQKQRMFIWLAIGGIAFLTLMISIIYSGYRRKKRMNLILQQQKNEIEKQKNEIEKQRDLATRQRDQISRQNDIITDSIEYARRIQNAILPQEDLLNQLVPDHFIFYEPKNIVSGDFYWLSQIDGKTVITVADCTGHGVPGAFMSMLGISLLNEIVNKNKVVAASEILNNLREGVITALHQQVGTKGSKDGMDLALCVINDDRTKLEFSGAYNPLYIIRKGELLEYKGNKMPVGIHAVKVDDSFKSQNIQLQKGDILYMFSDGYLDQFGGKDGMKFRQAAFKELLLKIAEKEMHEQQIIIKDTYHQWKGIRNQLDDVIVMGIKI